MFAALGEAKKRYEEITESMSDPAVISDQPRYRQLAREHSDLTPIILAYDQYLKIERELEEQQQLMDDPEEDPEIKALAALETPELQTESERLVAELHVLLVPKDPLDHADIVLEIRAGTGGEEAALFAGNLYRLYQRYAERQGWKIELLGSSAGDAGGLKEVILGVQGNEVYRKLKFESGVHRVQRVPQTESQGRIHTSAATVAVLPEAEEVEIEVNPSDLRIDVFRASGPGGQSVNTTDSAVRITHLPTGITAQSQDEKSQHKNKAKAMKVLRARIYDKVREEQEAEATAMRRNMVGSGDRSERIRTYNYPQGRVTDHRIGLTLYKLDQIMEGDIDEIVDALISADQAERLQQA